MTVRTSTWSLLTDSDAERLRTPPISAYAAKFRVLYASSAVGGAAGQGRLKKVALKPPIIHDGWTTDAIGPAAWPPGRYRSQPGDEVLSCTENRDGLESFGGDQKPFPRAQSQDSPPLEFVRALSYSSLCTGGASSRQGEIGVGSPRPY